MGNSTVPLNNNYCCSNNENAPTAYFDIENLIFQNVDFNKAETYKKLEKVSKEFVLKQELSQQYVPLISRIIANKQQHLIEAFKRHKTRKQKQKFMKSIEFVDVQLVDSLYHNVINTQKNTIQALLKPCDFLDSQIFSFDHKKMIFNKGAQAISNNKVGLLLLCGGSNIRFQSETPKFLIQSSLPSKKCIFQIILIRLKKIIESCNITEWNLNIFLMCNENNYQTIKLFLKKIHFCGIPQKFFHYFLQNMIPILNYKGELCLDQEMKIIESPGGSGEFLQSIVDFKMKTKIIDQLGIKYLYISGLQNILQKPCDPILIGQMIKDDAQIIAKCTDALNQQQSFYRYYLINNKLKSINPARLSQFICSQQLRLKRSPIFMNSMIFDTEYLNKLLMNPHVRFQIARIFHIQKRLYNYLDVRESNASKSFHENQQCFIFQKQLSDLFLASQKTVLVKVPRKQEYYPVIFVGGQYSLYEASKQLINLHQSMTVSSNLNKFLYSAEQIGAK